MASALREHILQAATRLFSDKGYAATSMREVAAAVGCTKPALYYHFDSKEALFLAAVRTHSCHYTQLIRRIFALPGSLHDKLRGAMEAYFAHIQAHPEAMRLLMTAEHRPEQGMPEIDMISLHQEHLQLSAQLLAAGVASGEISSKHDLMVLNTSLIGLVHIWGMHCLHGQPLPDDLPSQILDIFFHGACS